MKFVKKPARLQATQKEKPGGGQMLFVFHVGRSAHCPPPETCSGEQKTKRKMMRMMMMMVERSDQGEREILYDGSESTHRSDSVHYNCTRTPDLHEKKGFHINHPHRRPCPFPVHSQRPELVTSPMTLRKGPPISPPLSITAYAFLSYSMPT